MAEMGEANALTIGSASIVLEQGDITKIAADAIVNAANSALAGGGGVDGAIHRAGGPSLMVELQKYEGCPTGKAVVTSAGRLPARYVFHAVGPIYQGGNRGEPELLASCYRECLLLAQKHSCSSISFPSISTGIYGYPVEQAAEIALNTIIDALSADLFPVTLVKLVQFSKRDHTIYCQIVPRFQRMSPIAKDASTT
jgi:O-acetyl-ADP-ribose deacetylase (regulator of RNase III)